MDLRKWLRDASASVRVPESPSERYHSPTPARWSLSTSMTRRNSTRRRPLRSDSSILTHGEDVPRKRHRRSRSGQNPPSSARSSVSARGARGHIKPEERPSEVRYERRARHKPRPDLYSPKSNVGKKMRTTRHSRRVQHEGRQGGQSKAKRKGAPVTPRPYRSENVASERLTVRSRLHYILTHSASGGR